MRVPSFDCADSTHELETPSMFSTAMDATKEMWQELRGQGCPEIGEGSPEQGTEGREREREKVASLTCGSLCPFYFICIVWVTLGRRILFAGECFAAVPVWWMLRCRHHIGLSLLRADALPKWLVDGWMLCHLS